MATHKDVVLTDGNLTEWMIFASRQIGMPFPAVKFTPYPIAVPGLIFPDGSQQWTAGGGGTGVALQAGPGIILTPGMGTMTISTLPAGSNTQIQFNNNGAFGASPNLVWNNANSRMGIGTGAAIPSAPLQVKGPTWSNVMVGDAGPGVVDVLAGADAVTGYIDLAANAYFDGALWQMRNPLYEAWDVAMFCRGATSGMFQVLHTGPGLMGTTGWVSYFSILSNGNTGIAQQYPAYRLDVNGDINCTGQFRINGVPLGPVVYTGTGAPASPQEGSLWFDTSVLRLFLYHSNAWFQVSA